MTAKALASVLALAGDKSAALDAASNEVATAAARVILHGDAALFLSTAAALESRKGSTAAAILGRLKAAHSAALAARTTAYPQGRKGAAHADQIAAANSTAAALAGDFRAGCIADSEERSNKAKAAQAAAKAKREAAKPAAANDAAAHEAAKPAAAPHLFLTSDAAKDAAALLAVIGEERAAAFAAALQAAITAAHVKAAEKDAAAPKARKKAA